MKKPAIAFVVLALALLSSAALAVPTPSGNMSAFAAATAAPTPAPFCMVGIVDQTKEPGSMYSTGVVPVSVGDIVTALLFTSFPTGNSATVNGVQPTGWGNLASGANVTKTVDLIGYWNFVVTTAGCPANSVSVQSR